jgi:Leucine-rich repeat (LRR) protein
MNSALETFKGILATLADAANLTLDQALQLPQLTTLDLRNSGITSVAGLEKLLQLTTLDLRYTRITSIEMLAASQCLETLYLPRISSLNGLPLSVTSLTLE